MSLLDSYRRTVQRKRDEISKLQDSKAKEHKKVADLSSKIQKASAAMSRTNNMSTLQSKQREITRSQNELAKVESKIAGFEKKIAAKSKDIVNEEKKVAREEAKEFTKRQREEDKRLRDYNNRMSQIDNTLNHHNILHNQTQIEIAKIKQLPEKVVALFFAANPQDQVQLRLDEEVRSINNQLKSSKYSDCVKLESYWAIRPFDVLYALNEFSPAIVHFSGHGSEKDEIVFLDNQGQSKLVSKDAIVQTMMASSEGIRLIFFNTCYSRNQAEAVVEHVEAAIGMNTSISDDAARIFSSQFYSSIGFGLSVQKSFDQAKALLMMEDIPEENTPELFVQDGIDPNELFIVQPNKS